MSQDYEQTEAYWTQVWEQMPKDQPIRWKAGEAAQDFHAQYELITAVTKLESARILVPLCGDGAFVSHAAARGHSVVAIDISKVACDLLTRKCEEAGVSDRVTVIHGDIFEKLEALEENSFHLIFDKDAFGCIKLEQRSVYADKLTQVLQVGGHIYLEGKRRDVQTVRPPYNISSDDVRRAFRCGERFALIRDGAPMPFQVHPSWKQVSWMLRRVK